MAYPDFNADKPSAKKKGKKSHEKNRKPQDLFLLSARRNRTSVTVFLVNGFQMRGVITGFDSFVVILESDGKQQMLYKHAISTIVPIAAIDLKGAEESEE
ncbi:RNA chaperone Hfq [Ruminococcaceae bacterium AF10-16]|nr:RNA chaperone Hfq [Ruminococcaceae bacterium AF10-16]